MKLIQKMVAIMFAFMMVLGMGTNVKAEEGSQPNTEGSITITNALPKQEYKLYRILELESFNDTSGAYSYKLSEKWNGLISDTSYNARSYLKEENGYVTWIYDKSDDAAVRAFVKEALRYAQDKNIKNDSLVKNDTDFEKSIIADNLPLGYYLVDSSVGTLCGLNTTNPNVTIQEKNGTPAVEKKVSNTANENYDESNFANIGDTVYFQTSITAQAGARNYVLHDTMGDGLTLNKDSISIKYEKDNSDIDPVNYTINYDVEHTGSEKTCTFDITFNKDFCNTLTANQKIVVTYSAILNGEAEIHDRNVNTTHLSYGDNNKTNESETSTVTYEIKVLKYSGTLDNALKGATFKLYDSEVNENKPACKNNPIQLVKNGNDGQNYRRALKGEENSFAEVTTTENGTFSIQGLKPGTYYLEETAAPKGYNKLSKKIEVVITDDGTLIVDGKSRGGDYNLPISQVNVENKTGTLLPSTGGMGTTMIYMAGAILVIASGIVLVSKKRSKAK